VFTVDDLFEGGFYVTADGVSKCRDESDASWHDRRRLVIIEILFPHSVLKYDL